MTILPPEQHSSGSNTRFTRGKSAEKKEKEAVRPHAKIPHEDLDWVLTQSPTVMRLFMESWRCESFGKQWRILKTELQKRNLRNAMKILEKASLFKYQPVVEVINGRRVTTSWKCENLHGYYTNYWDSPVPVASPNGIDNTLEGIHNAPQGIHSTLEGIHNALEGIDNTSQKPETRATTDAAENQPRLNHVLTTPLPPTKVVEGGSCISQETQQTPLRGAAATSGEMQEEEEDAPDTSTASVEDKQEVNGTPINLGGGESSGGGDIARKPNSYVVETGNADRYDIEIGHADIIETICEQVAVHYYHPTKEQREQMMQLTISQLQVLSQRFQKQMSNRMSSVPNCAKTKGAFEFALGLAKHSAPV